VDNASNDGSADLVAERFPDVHLLRLETNVGLADALNRAAACATGNYLLMMNGDSEATPRSVERLVEFLDAHPRCGAATGRLLNMQEEPQRDMNVRRLPTFLSVATELLLLRVLWPTNPVTLKAMARDIGDSEPAAIEQAPLACLAVRREAFDQIGGLDGSFYPAWFEDADLCRRLIDAGWTIDYVPGAVFRHAGSLAAKAIGREQYWQIWYRNLERYVRKHYGLGGTVIVKALITVGMILRVVGSAVRADRQGLTAFGRVLTHSLTGWRHHAAGTRR
jgi:GT2 family glycosyltransferase